MTLWLVLCSLWFCENFYCPRNTVVHFDCMWGFLWPCDWKTGQCWISVIFIFIQFFSFLCMELHCAWAGVRTSCTMEKTNITVGWCWLVVFRKWLLQYLTFKHLSSGYFCYPHLPLLPTPAQLPPIPPPDNCSQSTFSQAHFQLEVYD